MIDNPTPIIIKYDSNSSGEIKIEFDYVDGWKLDISRNHKKIDIKNSMISYKTLDTK